VKGSLCWALLIILLKIRAAVASDEAVILISIDGFRHDYIDRAEAKNIRKLAKQGVHAKGLVPVYPSKTFPNHLSIVTGLYPANHGIVDNHFYDQERRQTYAMGDGLADSSWVTALPIWNLAEFQGVKAATFFWPESDARINGALPSYFYHYNTPTPNQQRVDQLIEWLKLPATVRPRLLISYFSDIDTAGHRFGPDAPETAQAIADIDQLIGYFLARLGREIDQPVNLLLVSDHGMATTTAAAAIDVDDLPINDKQFRVVNSTTRLMLYAHPRTSADQINAQRQALIAVSLDDAAIDVMDEKALAMRHYTTAHRHHSRIADIIVEATAPATFHESPSQLPTVAGNHGFFTAGDDTERYMDGLFIAHGPAFQQPQTIDRIDTVDLYPLIAELLELELLTPIDGSIDALQPILKPE